MTEDIPEWAKKLIEQLGVNCKKLDDMKTTLDVIAEMCKANGEGIEVLSSRMDKAGF